MKNLACALALMLALPAAANAIGIQGSVFKSTGGLPVYPCDIDIWDRQNNVFVVTNADTTLPNGSFNLVLPNGRYDLTFKPGKTTHLFQGFVIDARVNNNTLFFNVPLATGVYVSGRVLGPDNVGVNFTNLRLRNSLGAAPVNIQDNNTNPDGTFKMIVDPGTWDIGLVPALATHRAPVEFPAVNCSGDVNLGDVHVPLGVVMTCTVTDPSLFPVSGAAIAVRTNPGRDRVFVPNNNTSGAGSVQICLAAGSAYDVCATPPPGLTTTYATWSQYGVLADVDKTLANFALPAGRQLSAHVVGGAGSSAVVSADLDVDWMQAPVYPRVETPGDITNALGNFAVTVGNGTYRVTVNPPVATKLLPVRIPNVTVGAAGLNMGTLTCPTGHWVDITVVTQGTNVPVQGANIDLENIATGTKLITVGDVTNASGFARIVSDQALYTIKISPPNSTLDTAYVLGGFRSLGDTTITVVMPRKGVLGVGDRAQASLELAAPWPNPARGGVSFAFKGRGTGTLEILDLAGRRIATPWQGDLAAATTVRWDGHDTNGREVPGGMYFARLRTDAETRLRRVVWVK